MVHYVLHLFLKSPYGLLRRVGALHQAHHDFYMETLQFDERYARANLLHHVIPEYANQVMFTLPGYFLVGPWPVAVALAIETFIFAMVVIRGGMDEHHIAADRRMGRRNYPGGLFVTADYHSLHHIHPDRFFSSYVTLFDRLMGTACGSKGRRVAPGRNASGAFGSGDGPAPWRREGHGRHLEAWRRLHGRRRLARRRGTLSGQRHPGPRPRGEGGSGDGGELRLVRRPDRAVQGR